MELLKEFINSGDTTEARRCLLELEVPHFHHELVYQVCSMFVASLMVQFVLDMSVEFVVRLVWYMLLLPQPQTLHFVLLIFLIPETEL